VTCAISWGRCSLIGLLVVIIIRLLIKAALLYFGNQDFGLPRNFAGLLV